ncbi:MAG TPA: 2OG-Fe(II) oxygenase [Gammaproteobacteria bacterium]
MSSTVAEIEMAERYDAEGRHDEAIDCLARATQRGSVEAKTRLAKRLIIGDRAPLLWRQGASLMSEAAKEGGAEAAALLAVLAAAGLGGRHDWQSALELARLAAARGFRPAAEQLRVLAAASGGRIGVASWANVPAAVALHDGPDIRLFPSFVNEDVCAWLIERSRGRLVRARVYDVASKENIASEVRTNSAAGFNLMETDLVHLMVQTRMSLVTGLPLVNMEGATVLHYAVGEQITNHYDFIDPATPGYEEEVRVHGERVVTFLVYLNDDYEGGETEFPRLGVRHKGRRGDGLYFVNALPSGGPDLRSWHAGRPPLRGEKWVLSQFIRNRRVLDLV